MSAHIDTHAARPVFLMPDVVSKSSTYNVSLTNALISFDEQLPIQIYPIHENFEAASMKSIRLVSPTTCHCCVAINESLCVCLVDPQERYEKNHFINTTFVFAYLNTSSSYRSSELTAAALLLPVLIGYLPSGEARHEPIYCHTELALVRLHNAMLAIPLFAFCTFVDRK